MLTLKLSDVKRRMQAALGEPIKLKTNVIVMGVDTAPRRTGICILTAKNDTLTLDTSFISLQIPDRQQLYQHLYDAIDPLIRTEMELVIEDSFLKFNPNTFRVLAQSGAIVWSLGYRKRVAACMFLTAGQARKRIGVQGNAKKADAHKQFQQLFKLNFDDPDIADAAILAIAGLVK